MVTFLTFTVLHVALGIQFLSQDRHVRLLCSQSMEPRHKVYLVLSLLSVYDNILDDEIYVEMQCC